MKTPTHVVINLLLADRLGWSPRTKWLFVLGGAAPDIPIMLAFCGFVAASGFDFGSALGHFRDAYATEALLIAAHNLLHAPLSLALLFLTSLAFRSPVATAIQAFLMGCVLHSFIDIYTHVDDGPLMLWPFEWVKRFDGPLSHWDPQHFGYLCLMLEAVLIAGFLLSRLWSRARRGALAPLRSS